MMMLRPAARLARQALGAGATLLSILLALQPAAGAATISRAVEPARPLPGFIELARQQPRKCPEDEQAALAPPGWRQRPALCAWQGRLRMRRWDAGPAAVPGSCVSAPAQWWAWQQKRNGIASLPGALAWRADWRTQYLASDVNGRRHIVIVEAGAGTSWVATEWIWSPSPRPATRDWQEQRWKSLAKAGALLTPFEGQEGLSGEAVQLRRAWEKNLNGRAGEIAPDGWVWQSGGRCMRLTPLEAAEVQLRLPYAREDARSEQRAAMQVQLARRYPDATWPIPFRLLELPGTGGAKYEAIRLDKTAVTGQLWIPVKSGDKTVRAAIRVGLPPGRDSATTELDGVAISRVIEKELVDIARIWSVDYER